MASSGGHHCEPNAPRLLIALIGQATAPVTARLSRTPTFISTMSSSTSCKGPRGIYGPQVNTPRTARSSSPRLAELCELSTARENWIWIWPTFRDRVGRYPSCGE